MPISKYPISEAEYLRVEEADPERHEYVAGRMFVMSGASFAHNVIVINLIGCLLAPSRSNGCKVLTQGMKVKVESLGSIYYPDVVVTCENADNESRVLAAPCLIIEVLSPSTKSIDKREKLQAYQTIPSVKEYLIVSQDRRCVELCRKDPSGNWEFDVYKDSDRIQLTAIANQTTEVSLDDIYSGIHSNSK
jgi:Uma2 family endonuclease